MQQFLCQKEPGQNYGLPLEWVYCVWLVISSLSVGTAIWKTPKPMLSTSHQDLNLEDVFAFIIISSDRSSLHHAAPLVVHTTILPKPKCTCNKRHSASLLCIVKCIRTQLTQPMQVTEIRKTHATQAAHTTQCNSCNTTQHNATQSLLHHNLPRDLYLSPLLSPTGSHNKGDW